jgi:hypothetical protein
LADGRGNVRRRRAGYLRNGRHDAHGRVGRVIGKPPHAACGAAAVGVIFGMLARSPTA